MDSTLVNLPVIDFNKIKTDRFKVANAIVDALRDVGFMLIENVNGLNSTKLHRACEWFFALSKEKKLEVSRKRWNPKSSKVYRGYFPNDPLASSNKECFEFGIPLPEGDPELLAGNVLYENPLWPEEDGNINFKEFMTEYYELMHNTSITIMRLIALGLGFDEFTFDPMFINKPLSTLRLLHYPPRSGPIPNCARSEDGKVIQCGEHTDSTILTLLETFNYDGLEILTQDGTWKAATSRPETLVVNIGDMLAQFTGGRLKATKHRVVDLGQDRYSVPFFLEPSYHADIGKPPLPPDTDRMKTNMPKGVIYDDAKPCKYGHWLVRTYKEKKYVEYSGIEKELKEL